jgi:hypothetical protein
LSGPGLGAEYSQDEPDFASRIENVAAAHLPPSHVANSVAPGPGEQHPGDIEEDDDEQQHPLRSIV